MSRVFYPLLLISAFSVVFYVAYGNYTLEENRKEAIKLLNNDALFIIGEKEEYPNKLNDNITLLSISYKKLVLSPAFQVNMNSTLFNEEEIVEKSRDFLGMDYLCQRKEYNHIPVTFIYRIYFVQEGKHLRFKRELKGLC